MHNIVNGTVPPPEKSSNPLQTYAQDMSLAVETLTTYQAPNNITNPSSRLTASNLAIPPTAPPAVHEAKEKILASVTRIQQLVIAPGEYLPDLAIHYQVLSCLQWLSHFQVLSFIPLDGDITYSKLAKIASVPDNQLRSVARMVMTSNFLSEPAPDIVAHNPVSRLFVDNPGFMDWLKFMTQFSMPSAAAFAQATEKWGSTDQKNQTAFNLAAQTNLPLFDYFAKSPETASQFASYMKSVQASHGTSLQHLLTGYDWKSLGEAVVVDVGGSTCASSIALAKAFPGLNFIVQDLPDTISNSTETLAAQPEDIRSRITTQSYDFFAQQTFKGGDIYLLRMILHDWPFGDAVSIVKNQMEALKANSPARLIIMDTVLPSPGSISIVEEALLRVRDLTMIQAFNSRERELDEVRELFAQASDQDGCLVLENIIKPPGSVMSVMEVAYHPSVRSGNMGSA